MRKSRFSEEQIIAILGEQERGETTAQVCRRHGISTPTFYKWKAKYGGMDVSDARRLKLLETENGRLKKLLADQMLDNAVLKDLLGKSRRRRWSGGRPRWVRWSGSTSPSAERAAWSASARRPCGGSGRPIARRSGRGCARSRPNVAASATAGSG